MLPASGAFTKWYFQIIPSAEFAVDAFFMMSGFLVTYQVLQLTYKYMAKQQDSGLLATLRGMRVPVMLLHRWLRLAPLLMTVILLQMYIVPLLSTGPVWNVRIAASRRSLLQPSQVAHLPPRGRSGL